MYGCVRVARIDQSARCWCASSMRTMSALSASSTRVCSPRRSSRATAANSARRLRLHGKSAAVASSTFMRRPRRRPTRSMRRPGQPRSPPSCVWSAPRPGQAAVTRAAGAFARASTSSNIRAQVGPAWQHLGGPAARRRGERRPDCRHKRFGSRDRYVVRELAKARNRRGDRRRQEREALISLDRIEALGEWRDSVWPQDYIGVLEVGGHIRIGSSTEQVDVRLCAEHAPRRRTRRVANGGRARAFSTRASSTTSSTSRRASCSVPTYTAVGAGGRSLGRDRARRRCSASTPLGISVTGAVATAACSQSRRANNDLLRTARAQVSSSFRSRGHLRVLKTERAASRR